MQPYLGDEQAISSGEGTLQQRFTWRDLTNISLVVLAWALLLVLVTPRHEFPTTDDYLYAGSVRDMLDTGRFIMPDFSQANILGQVVWGALWARLFGFSLTVLTYSTLFLALLALISFYAIARAVHVPPWGALLGTGLLEFNPLFVHLSYSFMTDVPFLACMLFACNCYIRGIQRENGNWMVIGGLFAGWSFLIRQFGALVPAAFLVYLVFDGLLSRRWRWKQMLLILVVPAALALPWEVRSLIVPATSASGAALARAAAFVGKDPWLRVFLLRSFTLLALAAFFVWGPLKLQPLRWLFAPLLFVGTLAGMQLVTLPAEKWIGVDAPAFTAQLGPISYNFPNQPFSFAAVGNIVQTDGIDFDEFGFAQQPVWSMEAWRSIWMFGIVLASAVLTKVAWSLWDWLRSLRRGAHQSPVIALYLLGAMLWVASFAFAGDLFDRYLLVFIPFLILFVVRGSPDWGKFAWSYSAAALTLLAIFTVLGKADYMDHQNARWQAALWMEARVGAVQAGWNWAHWGHAESPDYRVSDVHADGFRTEEQFPYTSRLSAFATRYVLAESRIGTTPLPVPKP